MKEYDLDSYVRKWRQTCGFFTTAKGELKQGTFTDFFEVDRHLLGVEVLDGDGHETRYALEKSHEDYNMVKIEYHPIQAGWYVHKNGLALLVRKHIRGFQQGLSLNNHYLSVYDHKGKDISGAYARFHWCDFLCRPEYTKFAPGKPFGVMSDRMWWKDGFLFFLHRTIGCYNDAQITLEDRAFIPYVRPFVEDSCRISS